MEADAAHASHDTPETLIGPQRSPTSLLRYSPALVLLIAVLMNAAQWTDVDPWLRILLGRLTIARGHAPTSESFSYTAFGHPWWDHEWLTEVLFAAIYDKFGVLGLKLLKLACSCAIAALLAAALAETGAAVSIQLPILLASAIGLAPFVQYRPQLFTFLFTSALLAVLARENYRRTAPLWLAIPICLLWANLHGAFFVGLGILATYTTGAGAADLIAGRGLWRGIRLGAITIAVALATLVNPYGIRLWTTVLASSGRWMKGLDTQWQPTLTVMAAQLHGSPATFVCLVVVLAATAALGVLLVVRPRADDLPLVVVAAVVTASGLAAIRNLPLQALAIVAPLARRAGLLFGPAGAAAPAPPPRRSLGHELIIVAVALMVALATGELSGRLINTVDTPTGAVAFMRRHDLHGNVLCDFDWAAYFIAREVPPSRIFIDGRQDMAYPIAVLRDYIIFTEGGAGAAAVLRRYPPDYVLIPLGKPGYRFMSAQPDWRLVYRDNVSALFARADSPAARIDGVPVQGHSGPDFAPL
jgi:hypothetical protein